MRERGLGALIGIVAAGLIFHLARISWGLWLGTALGAALGWGLGGYIRHLTRLAERDPLTGLVNRRPLERAIEQEWERAVRYRRPLSLIFIEIDDFGAVNKRHGHLMGDEALKTVAREMRSSIRSTDLLARWGGDEFILLLPETEHSHALVLAERIRATVEGCLVRDRNRTITVTVSAGVASVPGSAHKSGDLLRLAVEAQRRAKEQKNSVSGVS